MFEKKTNQPIVYPLTSQEKEEEYELHIHIITFTLEDTPLEEVNSLQVAIVPSMQKLIEPTQ